MTSCRPSGFREGFRPANRHENSIAFLAPSLLVQGMSTKGPTLSRSPLRTAALRILCRSLPNILSERYSRVALASVLFLYRKGNISVKALVTPSVVPISILQAPPCKAIPPVLILCESRNDFNMTICLFDWSPNSKAGSSVNGRPREVLLMLMLPSPSKYPATWAHELYGGVSSSNPAVGR